MQQISVNLQKFAENYTMNIGEIHLNWNFSYTHIPINLKWHFEKQKCEILLSKCDCDQLAGF
jgi:hypothetical protein